MHDAELHGCRSPANMQECHTEGATLSGPGRIRHVEGPSHDVACQGSSLSALPSSGFDAQRLVEQGCGLADRGRQHLDSDITRQLGPSPKPPKIGAAPRGKLLERIVKTIQRNRRTARCLPTDQHGAPPTGVTQRRHERGLRYQALEQERTVQVQKPVGESPDGGRIGAYYVDGFVELKGAEHLDMRKRTAPLD